MSGSGSRGESLTRISVSGTRDCYLVRTGRAQPVRVWATRNGLRCECGQPNCQHVLSLQLCGFVETSCDRQQAA